MNFDDYIESFKELYHFGIKGMRWGVRRYQNKDGSLTSAGRNRYSDQGYGYDVKYSSRQKLDKAVRKKWYKSYNKASNEFNYRVQELNSKYPTGMRDKRYVKAVGKLWKDTYSKYLVSDFGADPMTGSKDWVASAPFMDAFERDI